jgi:hypothetical protein
MEQDAINLTLIHEWMTVYDAKLLLHDYYMKVRPYKKYHGWSTVRTHMSMFYGHLQRDTEANLRARIGLIKSRTDFNSTNQTD